MKTLAVRSVERWLPERPGDIPAEQMVEYKGIFYILRSRAAHDAIWQFIDKSGYIYSVNSGEELVDMDAVNAEIQTNADIKAQIFAILLREYGNPLKDKMDMHSESLSHSISSVPRPAANTPKPKIGLSQREVEDLLQTLKATFDINLADIRNRLTEIEEELARNSSRLSMLFWTVVAIFVGALVAVIEKKL